MARKAYAFDEQGFRRIQAAVRRVESSPRVGSQRRRQPPVLSGGAGSSSVIQLIPWGFGTGGTVELDWTIPNPESAMAPVLDTITLDWDADAADLQSALAGHNSLDHTTLGDLVAVGGGPWPYSALTVHFIGPFRNHEIALPEIDVSSLTGGAFPQVMAMRQLVNGVTHGL